MGKTDADAAAATGENRGVDADQLTAQIDQRAAGIAGVDGGVGLDKILVAFNPEAAAAEGADDARSDRLAEAERVADGHHEIAHAQIPGIAERDFGKPLAVHPAVYPTVYLNQGDVALGIRADQLRFPGSGRHWWSR